MSNAELIAQARKCYLCLTEQDDEVLNSCDLSCSKITKQLADALEAAEKDNAHFQKQRDWWMDTAGTTAKLYDDLQKETAQFRNQLDAAKSDVSIGRRCRTCKKDGINMCPGSRCQLRGYDYWEWRGGVK